MANRNYPSQRIFGFHMAPVNVDASISISGTAGTPALGATSKGVASVSRLAAGTFKITLQDPYNSLLSVHGTMVASASATPSRIASIQVAGSSASASGGGTVTIITVNDGGSIADPANGEAIQILMRLNNSSVQ